MAPQVIVVIGGLLALLIAVGVIYKLACGRKKHYDDEEDDDDEDDSGNWLVIVNCHMRHCQNECHSNERLNWINQHFGQNVQ